MTMETPRLRLTGIRKRFGATLALDGVSLAIAPGEVHALVGENGAGKSTLMKVLSGVHAPDAGTMELEGIPFAPLHPLNARRAGVVMVNQELAIAPHLTVAENVGFGLRAPKNPVPGLDTYDNPMIARPSDDTPDDTGSDIDPNDTDTSEA